MRLPDTALLSLLCLSGLAGAATNHTLPNECRAFPGSRDWPSADIWKGLNETLGGRLLAPAPPGAVCHPEASTYDADQCPNVQRNWTSYQWHTENPVSVMRDQFTKYSCLPDPKAPCSGHGYPPYVVDASTAEHVKIGVDFARRHNIRLVVRGTGHDFVGRSIAPGALSIWTHGMDDMTFRPGQFRLGGSGRVLRGSAVTVGAGAQMLDIYKAADKYGQTIVGGAGKSVGITGYVTGGGHSVLAPRFGLAADNVLEIEVVTPAGKLITANEDRHPDLFWAMRGGGGSTFGVITKMTMRTHPTPSITSIRWMAVTDAKSPFLYDLAASAVSKFPQLVRAGISGWNFVTNHITDPIPEPGRNASGPLAGAFGITLMQNSNDSNVAQRVFQPMRDEIQAKWPGKARLLLQTKHYPSFLAWITENYDMSLAGNSLWAVSRLLDERALTSDVKALGNALKAGSKPTGSLMVFLVSGKGAKNARPRGGGNAVNPAWRSAFVHALTVAEYAPFNKSAERDTIDVLDASFQPMRDLTPRSGAYINEALPFEKDWQHSFWGSNYERLVKIKREIDPTDVLCLVQHIDYLVQHIDYLVQHIDYPIDIMTIDHTSLVVPRDKFNDCLDVYLAALKPLGYEQRHQYGETVVGLGSTVDPAVADYSHSDFWVTGADGQAACPVHIAFAAADRKTVDAFHAAAVKAGATCNGPPGLRSHYHANYYAAFVLDPAGNNIEAVCHNAQ